MEVITIKNLNKEYKKFKLDNISFSLSAGTICGFIGENGAGKSTTLKILAGITSFNSGMANIFEKNIDKLSKNDRDNISFILDELNFPDSIKIFQLEKVLHNIFLTWDKDCFFDYLTKFNIDKNKRCKELSKGMKVKLNLAISLSHKAKVFILDEPTNGLDPIARDEILDILSSVALDGGTVLISSHIVEDLERICNQIIFIHQGRIILNEYKKDLLDMYDYFKVDQETWDKIDKSMVIKYKDNVDGVHEFITLKDKLDLENKRRANLSDIMILIVRGKSI